MNTFGKFQKLLFALIAIIGLPIAASHLCSVLSHTTSHHQQNQTEPTTIAYNTDITSEQCCVNKSSSKQLTNTAPQVQKLIVDFQSILVTTFYIPISTAAASSSSFQIPPHIDKPDPGGGLILRC